MDVCLICNSQEGHLTLLTTRGLKSIKEFAKLQNDVNVQSKVKQDMKFHVHKNCQKFFTNKGRIKQNADQAGSETHKETRSKATHFCWESQCFLCEEKLSMKNKIWSTVKTLGFRDSILKDCNMRLLSCADDSWACSVKSKLATCFDLVAVGATYHNICRLNFKNGNQVQNVGRPKETETMSAFEQACIWLEQEIEIHTLSEIANKIKEFSETEDSFSNVHIKRLLERKYGQFISVSPISNGKKNIITFKNTAKFFINLSKTNKHQ